MESGKTLHCLIVNIERNSVSVWRPSECIKLFIQTGNKIRQTPKSSKAKCQYYDSSMSIKEVSRFQVRKFSSKPKRKHRFICPNITLHEICVRLISHFEGK